jgi:hypothetical protein
LDSIPAVTVLIGFGENELTVDTAAGRRSTIG